MAIVVGIDSPQDRNKLNSKSSDGSLILKLETYFPLEIVFKMITVS